MDPALQAALEAPAFRLFSAVRITLPNGDIIRLLDGPAVLIVGTETYTGRDATYGVLSAVPEVTDGISNEAPTAAISIDLPTLAAVNVLCDPGVQGSPITVQQGCIDLVTGVVVGVEPIFLGEIDVPTFQPDPGSPTVEFACVSVFERFFDRDEGARLNNAFWTSIWPGDSGMEYVTRLNRQVSWGSASIGPSTVTYPTGGGGNGPKGGSSPTIPYA